MYTLNKKQAICIASLFTSAIVVSMSSCANHDFDWDSARCENQEYNYNYNFEQLYGTVEPYQSWDFSGGAQLPGTRAEITTISTERVPGLIYGFNSNRTTVTGSTVNDNNALYTTIQNVLKDGQQHTGEAAVLVAPSNGFWIYPVTAQGQFTYTLYVKVGNEDPIEVFSKGWSDGSKPYCNGMKTGNDVNQCSVCKGTGVASGDCASCEDGYIICGSCEGDGTIEVEGETTYTIKNRRYQDYLNGNSIKKSSYSYKIINNSGADYLYCISDKKFLKMSSDGNLSMVNNINEASAIDRTEGLLKIGNYYVYGTILKGNNVQLATSSKNNDFWGEYYWTFTPTTNTSEQTCTACNGTGKGTQCTACGGTGKSEQSYCKNCNGSGYSGVAQMPGLYIEAPTGTPITIYIHVNGKNLGTATGHAIVVDDVNTQISDLDKRLGLQDEYVLNFIGIEDQENFGDKDYNDLTLLLIGKPYVPGKTKIEESFIYPQVEYKKRYMVEDMGYSDGGTSDETASLAVQKGYTDIDFNDIVIDFEQVITHKYKITKRDGIPTTSSTDEEGYPTKTTTATVRALGGTWDFILYVGDDTNGWYPVFRKGDCATYPVTFNENYPTWADDPDISGFVVGEIYNTGNEFPRNDGQYNLTGNTSWLCKLNSTNVNKWNPSTNNIRFKLIDEDSKYGPGVKDDLDSKNDPGITSTIDGASVTGKNVYTFGFPKAGAIPKIVAFPTTKAWKRERVPARRDFFTGYAN